MPHLNRAAIEAAYTRAPGHEIEGGKFLSQESSAALAANVFGLFLDRPQLAPPLPGLEHLGWPAERVALEAIVRFPWSGGRHPCLDVLIETGTALIGVESKRYEPFRPRGRPDLSAAYWRPVWGARMTGYQQVRDHLGDGSLQFTHLDATQLVKHALGLCSAGRRARKLPVLVYVYAEPDVWPNERPIPRDDILRHRQEIDFFRLRTRTDEVKFVAISYRELLAEWGNSADTEIQAHLKAIREHFALRQGHGLALPFETLWRSDEPLISPA